MFPAAYHKPVVRRKPAPRTHHSDQENTRSVLFRCLMTVTYLRRVLPHPSWQRNPNSWKYFVGHIRTVWRRQIRNWRENGVVKPSQAERLHTCNGPGSRRHCGNVACPWCWFRRFLYLSRIIWHHAIEPALRERRAARRREKPRTRLAVGVVVVTVTEPADVAQRLAQLQRGERIVRKIQTAGGIDDGIACTSIVPTRLEDGRIAWRIHVAVLGLTELAVQREDPQPQRSVDWRIRWTAGVQKHRPNLPQLGPRVLMNLLAKAFPYPAEFLDCSLPPTAFAPVLNQTCERVRGLGRWRDFVEARPSEFPPPCALARPTVPAPTAKKIRAAHVLVESELVSLQSSLGPGRDATAVLQRFDISPSLRYAALARSGSAAADALRDDAYNELLRDPALIEVLRPHLPESFVQTLDSESVRARMAAFHRDMLAFRWDGENGAQLRHYVSKQLLKSLGFGPIGIARMKGCVRDKFLHPGLVCDELGLPIKFLAMRDYDVELEGAFPHPASLKEHLINDLDWEPMNSRDRVTLPCSRVYERLHAYAQKQQRADDYLPMFVQYRRKLARKPAWVAVVFRPAWATGLQVLHNFEPVEGANGAGALRLRTRSGRPLYLQELTKLLGILSTCLESEMGTKEYGGFRKLCRWYGPTACGVEV